MLAILARNWWLLALRGVVAIMFGIMALVWIGLIGVATVEEVAASLEALVLLFGAYALVDGVFVIGAAIKGNTGRTPRLLLLLEGIAGVIFGILTFLWPSLTALVLLYLIAAWALIGGIFEIMAAIELRREINNEWMLILGGIASVVFGLLLVIFPGAGALAVIWLIGSYAILFGVILLALAFRLRAMQTSRATG
jgi:uncharacterized membrane protein HdeD (DUF308 family)